MNRFKELREQNHFTLAGVISMTLRMREEYEDD